MKLRKIAVAFVLLVALFAASVVPVVACTFMGWEESRTVTRTDSRTAPSGAPRLGSWSPSSVFQSVSIVVNGRHHWHDGTLTFQHVQSIPTEGEWLPRNAPSGTTQNRTVSQMGRFAGNLRNTTTCPF